MTDTVMTDDDEPKPGDIIADRYRIVAILGRGSMGIVYRGEHVTVGRAVAVKVLASDWANHASISRRFRAEARAASAAGHPNIIEVLDAGDLDNGRPYLVTEFIDGNDLFDEIQEQGPMEVERACRVSLGVARALEAAHARGIIHRDLKLENVMLARHGKQEIIKVLDFGIAADTATARRPTTVGQVLGTPTAMAPEQAKGSRATPAFDIYALGGIAFEVLAARAPFESTDMGAIMAAKIDHQAPSITEFRQDLPPDFAALIDRCLARSPSERPQTATEIVRALERCLEGMREQTPPAVRFATGPTLAELEVAEPPPPRSGLRGLLLGALVVTGGGVAMWWSSGSDDAPTATIPTRTQSVEPTPSIPLAETPPPTPAAESSGETGLTEHGTHGDDETSDEASAGDAPSAPAAKTTRTPRRPKNRPASTPPSPVAAPPPHTPAPPANDCARTRKQARQARQNHDWRGALRYTALKSCWPDADNERLRLRTKALLELQRWDECIATGSRLSSAEAEGWVRTCRRRKDLD